MRVYTKTFGCRVNQYETESLREKLLSDGVSTATSDWESADLCVVNTCTVTGEADKDAYQLLRRISRRNPAARLVVTGCLATRDPQSVREAAPAATIVSNQEKASIPAMLGCSGAPEEAGIRSFGDRARAFLKVQDGCNMHCSYCIIPSIRPVMSSRPVETVEAELRGLVQNGYGEIVLCGIRLGRYLVQDKNGRRVDFCALLERLLKIEGDFRIRLSSFEITDLTDRFLDLFESAAGKICPSFHLPLQSGSDAVLKRMERWYSSRFYARRIESLRRRGIDCGLFTDLMVGFPGESTAEFEESAAFIREIGFSGLHVFRYSARAGTPAALDPRALPEAELVLRAEAMRGLDRSLRSAFAAGEVGRRRRVLIETGSEGTTEQFLKVSMESVPKTRFAWGQIISSDGPKARAVWTGAS